MSTPFPTRDSTNLDTGSINFTIPVTRNIPTSYITSYWKYQDVNADKKLQNSVTDYFLDEILYWLDDDKSFSHLKKYKKHFNSKKGFKLMHTLLKIFVKRGGTNWYDLKIQYQLVKKYLRHKLETL